MNVDATVNVVAIHENQNQKGPIREKLVGRDREKNEGDSETV